jgi:hypothetical protein
MPLTPELNIGREAYDTNASDKPASTTLSEDESGIDNRPTEHALFSDAQTTLPTVSSISTPASITSPYYQKQTLTGRNQGNHFEIIDNKKVTNTS